jgi:anti-sigma B factor antagonist
MIDKGIVKFLFNLEKTNFVDSLGLGLMLSIAKSLKKINGQFKICAVTSNIKNLFELTKLNQYFDIYDNKEEAIANFT